MEKALKYINDNKDRYLKEMIDWLKIESISCDSTKNAETRKAAEWCVKKLKDIGMENVKLIETGGHPVVYGDWLHAEGKPTVLVYGHYDVQPADPVEKWNTPPFEPTVKDGKIYGRGTSDDKGQMLTHVYALEALMKQDGKLPVNVKFFVEGEEEAGSEHSSPFVEQNADLLSCDAVTVSDTAWHSEKIPTIVYALRGLCYMEFIIKGPKRDLHSGVYGGELQNPLNAVGKIIAKLQDENGVVKVPGFYDDVVPLSDAEKKEFAAIGNHDEELKKELGIKELWGEKGYTTLERNWGRPSLDVNGMWGGFSGEGAKTVIPTHGGFKVSSRLVANQDPDKIRTLFEKYVNDVCPPGVTVETKYHHGGKPVLVPIDNFFIKAAVKAFGEAFDKKPALVREGASIPITATFMEVLKAPSVMMGFGLPDDNIHSPNEKLELEHFYKGIVANVYLYAEFAKK